MRIFLHLVSIQLLLFVAFFGINYPLLSILLVCTILGFSFFLKGFGGSDLDISLPSLFVVYFFCISFIALNVYYFYVTWVGGGHQALYLNNERSYFLLFLKLIAFPGYYLAFISLCVGKGLKGKWIQALTILSLLLSGSRGLFLFSVLSLIVIKFGIKIFFRPRVVLLGFLMVAGFLFIGYIREPINLDFEQYVFLVVYSLNEFAQSNLLINQCQIDSSLVIKQFDEVFLGVLNENRVTTALTMCVSPGAVEKGYGIASSLTGESFLLSQQWGLAINFFIIILNSAIVSSFFVLRSSLIKTLGLVLIPFVLYTVRAEVLYPLVFLIKGGVAILIAYCFNYILPKKTK